jgi:uncharacterized membrane protein
MVVVSARLYSELPGVSITPGHTMALGRPLIAFLLPVAAAAIAILFELLSPSNGGGLGAFRRIAFFCVLFVAALHAVLLTGLVAHIHQDRSVVEVVARVVPVLLGAALAVVGNQLPRLRPNLAIGIRTRRSLENPLVWARVNRAAGYIAVALGLSIVLCALAIPPGPALPGAIGICGFVALAGLCTSYWQAIRT